MPATTAYHRDMNSIETQKQRYSRELAEYTLRQWDIARQTMESEKAKDPTSSSLRVPSPKDKSRASQGQTEWPTMPLDPG